MGGKLPWGYIRQIYIYMTLMASSVTISEENWNDTDNFRGRRSQMSFMKFNIIKFLNANIYIKLDVIKAYI